MGPAAGALVLDLPAAILDTVRSLDHEGQRQAGDGGAALASRSRPVR